jgi:hypothetical protein
MPLSSASATDLVVLLPSLTATSGTAVLGSPVAVHGIMSGVQFVLDVTAAAAAVGDTLDVTVQGLVGGPASASGTWIDICHMTQILGNGGAKRIIAKILGSTAVTMYASGTLTAGNQKDVFADYFRTSYSIVDGGAHGQSFSWSVTALPF